MVDIQSKEVIDKISDELKIQPSLQIPRTLMDKIQLAYSVNPKREIKIARGTAQNATTATVLTASSVNDTFLTAASLSVSKSALATSVLSTLTCQPKGQAVLQTLLLINYEPTTAGDRVATHSFIEPILLERGSIVTVTNTTTVSFIESVGIVHFFETNPQ